jgi:hypothetical protein
MSRQKLSVTQVITGTHRNGRPARVAAQRMTPNAERGGRID